ncbi:MAG: gliding motility lipoprotein GldH [Bacteroidetes bacterium]|nr:gliding motility lipoprotein GldH [Bacteroidota bacterium]
MKRGIILFAASVVFLMLLILASCKSADVFERNISIPSHQWGRAFKPEISFDISDTVSLYNIYITLRHTHAYRYSNIWLNVQFQLPGDTLSSQRVNVLLATNEKGWLGTGMDDIWDLRQLITPQPFRFSRSGKATFILEQIMRDNPLPDLLNAGIRVEKVKR